MAAAGFEPATEVTVTLAQKVVYFIGTGQPIIWTGIKSEFTEITGEIDIADVNISY